MGQSERFAGKNVLITGGTSGIGFAGATRILNEGGSVILTGTNQGRIEATRQSLPGANVLGNDAADPDATAALVEAAKSMGGLDGLWLNAGYAAVGPLETVDAHAFNQMMNANVRGPALQLASLSPLLKKGASVVVTSSTSTYEGAAGTSLYAGTKGAIVAMARSWATALASRAIRVNVLVPGPIATGFRDFLPEEARKSFEDFVLAQVPLGRVGTAEEAAAVALFLLSDESSFVTGSQYAVDGGMTMR